MDKNAEIDVFRRRDKSRSIPPGRIKISEALKKLLMEKDFNAITTAEIAKTSGVNESLIYRYFQDKRGLLHQVLADYLYEALADLDLALKGIHGALNKLRKLIWFVIYSYDTNRIFAKMSLLEVRNYPAFFQSDAYMCSKNIGKSILEILEEGIRAGEIRDDIPLKSLRQIILGAIEHACLPSIIFDRKIIPDTLTEDICETIFSGIKK